MCVWQRLLSSSRTQPFPPVFVAHSSVVVLDFPPIGRLVVERSRKEASSCCCCCCCFCFALVPCLSLQWRASSATSASRTSADEGARQGFFRFAILKFVMRASNTPPTVALRAIAVRAHEHSWHSRDATEASDPTRSSQWAADSSVHVHDCRSHCNAMQSARSGSHGSCKPQVQLETDGRRIASMLLSHRRRLFRRHALSTHGLVVCSVLLQPTPSSWDSASASSRGARTSSCA